MILFAPLTASDVRRIASGYLMDLEVTLARAGKTIEIGDEVLDNLANEGYSVAVGARFLKRVIDDRIKLPITMHWNDADHFRIHVAKQAIVVEVVPMPVITRDRSEAYRDVA